MKHHHYISIADRRELWEKAENKKAAIKKRLIKSLKTDNPDILGCLKYLLENSD